MTQLLRYILLTATLLTLALGAGVALASELADAPSEETATVSSHEASANEAMSRIQGIIQTLDEAVEAQSDPGAKTCYRDKRAAARSFLQVAKQSRYALLRAIDRQKSDEQRQKHLDAVLLAEGSVQKLAHEISVCDRGAVRFAASKSPANDEGDQLAPARRAPASPGARSLLKKKRRSIDRCHRMIANSFGEQIGRLSVSVDVDASGQVAAVHITHSALHELLGQCVSDRIKRWTFPTNGRAQRIEHTFEWSAQR